MRPASPGSASSATPAKLDQMEGTHLPQGYQRITIAVERLADGGTSDIWAYAKNRATIGEIHGGPLAEYRLDPRYVPASDRAPDPIARAWPAGASVITWRRRMERAMAASLDSVDHNSTTASGTPQRAIGLWLLGCAAMVLAMAVIGAITRLTESGLSIMEWAPLKGALPPLSEAEWQRLFGLYREIPEYRQENAGMSLAEFKTIFWWEYIHRLWGRLIGLVFALPFFWFLLRRQVPRPLLPHLIGAFLLGALQGAMGWYMVASGFAERTDVSQYRLVAHLALAVVIYGYLLWLAFRCLAPRPDSTANTQLRPWLAALAGLIGVTILSGGFVAGLNAGMTYNTFPLMDGDLLPDGYGDLAPWHLNLFENVAAVQFNHRLLAVLTVLATLALWVRSHALVLPAKAKQAMHLLGGMALLQLALGIATLLLVVPVWLGALHQAGALILLGLALWAGYQTTGRGIAAA